MIIIDSSIWIDHIRAPVDGVLELLTEQQAIQHPFVTAELSLRSLEQRERFLRAIRSLPVAEIVQEDDWYSFVGHHVLYGTGLGFVDVHLLAAAVTSGHKLWSRDKRLAAHALRLECAFTSVSAY